MVIPVLLVLVATGQVPTSTAPAGSAPAAVATIVEPPRLSYKVDPVYPPEAWAAGREAAVALAIDIDAQGAVSDVAVLESGGADFDAAAVAAARQFVFTPAIASDGQSVPVRIRYRTRFVVQLVRTTTPAATSSTSVPAPVLADAAPAAPEPINFRGTIKETGTRAPVGFASVVVTSSTGLVLTSTEADGAGRFAFRGVPVGRHRVRVSAAFFGVLEADELITPREELEVLYRLERTARSPYEVFVRAKVPRKEVSRRTIQFEEIRRVPGTQGDAIRVIQNLPGVARAPFGLGLLVVRGAPPQSTGVFIDGHQIPLLFHFGGVGGVTSVINSRTLDQINFYPGGFSPEYGRLSAGVVELVSRDPATDRVHGEAQVDFLTVVPINVSVFLEGPLTSDPDDGAFFFSLRRSSIDGVFALATELLDASVALAPRYYDYQARWVKPLGDGADLSLALYGSDDELVLVGAPDLGPNTGGPTGTRSRTYFHRFNPRLRLKSGDDTELTISPIFGADFTDTETSGTGPNSDFSLRISNWSAGVRLDGKTKVSDTLRLSIGGELRQYSFDAEFVVPSFQSVKDFPSPINVDLPTRRDSAVIPVLLGSAYVEAEWSPLPGLTLWPGLRFDAYDFQAEEQLLVDPRLVEGRSRYGLDPRLTARYALTEDVALKGQAGIYREPPLPPQVYINADLPLQRAQQYSLGFDWDLIEKLSLDVQGFVRFNENFPRQTGDVEVVDGKVRPVGLRADGEQRAYGLELLLKLEERWGLYGWVAYTLSRSEFRRDDGEDDWDSSFFFDQTHNLNIVAVYELALNWHLGARFRFVTGGGLPATSARWYDADADAYRRDIEGEERAPPFHQLDLYIEKKWSFEEWYLELYLDVQNVYNATNTEAFIPTFDFKRTERLPGIPIFPSLGLRGTF